MKTFSSCLIVLIIASFQNTMANGIQIGERVVSPINQHEYFLTPFPTTWEDAEAYALSKGGHLATIRSQEENDWIKSVFSSYNPYIGLHQDVDGVEPSGGWSW